MDKEVITRAAREAVNDLQLDCEITEVGKPFGKTTWCVQFTGSYGQFCDEFQDKAGKENSARVIREKIKRFFLKQRKPTRIVRGKGPATKSRSRTEGNLLGTLMEVGEQALRQASRITSEVVERASTLNRAVLKTEADLVEGISPTAAELIRPDSASPRPFEAQPPRRELVAEQEGASQQTQKQSSRATKSARKAAPSVAVKTARASKATPEARASKKRAAKASTKKRASKKSATKAGRKKSVGKKRSGGKARR
ncbi:MAG TPA: hypothetical protein VGX92_18055 [Pyrinomonadaceae bacterium]|jgi:hypothetical protein|nr:hypothetical protein [Pyrinomonadaceae bacterium]